MLGSIAPNQLKLWNEIQSFELDEQGSSLPFSVRLARENDWSREFANQAIEEYKRFVFLAVTVIHPVTPSVEIDQVWHLHLTYTKSYWDAFCGDILGWPFHHCPTEGGREEGVKFESWYRQTLESYEQTFGESPPQDLWPAPAERFVQESLIRQVSGRTHWVIPKAKARRYGFLTGTFLLVLAGIGCASLEKGFVENDGFGLFVLIAIVFGVIIVISKGGRGGGGRKGGCSGGGTGCGSSGCGSSGCGSSGCGGGGCGGCGGG